MRLAEIERHVSSIEELQRIVGAMRAIASMRVQEALRALSSVRQYGSAMAAAVREALAIEADDHIAPGESQRGGRRAIVVFTSEHGFVGGFNERLNCWIHKGSNALGSSEGSHCAGFVFFDVENGVQLGDLEQVVDLLGEVQQLKIAALVADGGERADQLADP